MYLIHTYMLTIFQVVVIFAAETGATYYLPPKDAEEVVFDYTPLTDGLTVQIGTSKIDVGALYSPGHTIGSTSFVIDNKLFINW